MAQCYQIIGCLLNHIGKLVGCFLHHTGEFLWHISPALVTVVIGGLALQKFFVRRANASSLVDAVIKDLEILKSDALEYWNIDPSDKVLRSRSSVLEQKLKGCLKGICSDLTFFCSKYRNDDHLMLQNLLVDVADSVTGGDFESQNRTPAASHYISIVNTINNLRSKLLMTKF